MNCPGAANKAYWAAFRFVAFYPELLQGGYRELHRARSAGNRLFAALPRRDRLHLVDGCVASQLTPREVA